MTEVLLKGENISKTFQQGGLKNNILNGIDVEIYEGDFTIIMGSSGAGKSTLLYALSAMDRISEGKVFYKGTEITSLSEKQMAKLRSQELGFVFQQTHLVSSLTLFENVAVAGYVSHTGDTKKVRERTARLLRQMHVEQAEMRLPSQVSGGEAQRAAIARAMIGAPGLIFADEPTGSLNKSNTVEVLNLLDQINQTGQSILMVTHDLRAAVRGTRLLYLEDGKIQGEMRLPPYRPADEKSREQKINTWLSSQQW